MNVMMGILVLFLSISGLILELAGLADFGVGNNRVRSLRVFTTGFAMMLSLIPVLVIWYYM